MNAGATFGGPEPRWTWRRADAWARIRGVGRFRRFLFAIRWFIKRGRNVSV